METNLRTLFDANRPNRDRDKGLLIGIAYNSKDGSRLNDGVKPLIRAHRDVKDFENHLIRKWGFKAENITVMLDSKNHPRALRPTRENILRELAMFASNVQPGDRLVFYFAGHCYQLVCADGSEDDGYDEAILTCDNYGEPVDSEGRALDPRTVSEEDRIKLQGVVIDNEIHDILVNRLPNESTLVCVLDTCHSGTLLDLTHYWSVKLKRAMSLPHGKNTQGLPKQFADNNIRVYSDKKTRYPAPRKGTLASRRSAGSGDSGQSVSPQILIRPSSPEPGGICASPTAMEFITEEPEDMSQGIAQDENVAESSSKIFRRPARTLEATLVPVTPCSSSCSSGRSSPVVISISAGEDSHTVFENSERSFTTTLIDVLDTTDVLNMKQLVERLWSRIYMDVSGVLARAWKQKRKRSLGKDFSVMKHKFFNTRVPKPQIGCMHDLDLEAPFPLYPSSPERVVQARRPSWCI